MKNDWKENKWVQASLGVIILVTWGYSAGMIIGGLEEDEATGTTMLTPTPLITDIPKRDTTQVFLSETNDPFIFHFRVTPRDTTKMTNGAEVEQGSSAPNFNFTPDPTPPPLKVRGLVGNTVLIEDPSGVTHVWEIGKTVYNTKLIEVRDKSIWVLYKEHPFELKLE